MNLLYYVFIILNFISGIVMGEYIKKNLNQIKFPKLVESQKYSIMIYGFSAFLGLIPAWYYKIKVMPQDFFSNIMLLTVNLFGFCGLIITFVFGKLLDEKSKLEQYGRENYLSDLEVREKYKMSVHNPGDTLKALLKEYANKGNEIKDKINLNQSVTQKAYKFGMNALSYTFVALIGILFLYMTNNEYGYIVMWLLMSLLFAGFFSLIICIRILIKPVTTTSNNITNDSSIKTEENE